MKYSTPLRSERKSFKEMTAELKADRSVHHQKEFISMVSSLRELDGIEAREDLRILILRSSIINSQSSISQLFPQPHQPEDQQELQQVPNKRPSMPRSFFTHAQSTSTLRETTSTSLLDVA